jgi:hypothetical protein
MDFQIWMNQLRSELVLQGIAQNMFRAHEFGTDEEWGAYYDQGYTPALAVETEYPATVLVEEPAQVIIIDNGYEVVHEDPYYYNDPFRF